MAFVTLEDLTGSIEVTVFSELYLQNMELLQSGEPLLIAGTREGEQDTPKVLASEIHRLQDAPRFMSKGIQIMISARGTDPLQIKDLKTILECHPGRLPVKLHVVIPNRTETVISLSSVFCDPSEGLVASVHKTFGQHSISFE
jgi:DNA polymerase-3 subunit alpha